MKIKMFFFSIVLFGCVRHFSKQEVIGEYSPIGYKRTYDTIELKPEGIYHRRVYDSNKKLQLDLTSKWELRDGGSKIFFHSFFLNFDRDIAQFPELLADTTGASLINLDKNTGTIEFCVGYFSADLPDQNCYRKIK
ncbi:MAG: hypothetical protein KF704_07995 [Crocinitomicaceae bacterium]|nr:hypothetical protein [Crocinitomicaceae bacterium]